MSTWSRLGVGVAVTLLGAACGDDGSTGPTRELTGEQLYARACASCHGADLRGTALGPSQLSIVYEPSHHPDDSYRAAIRNGVAQHHWNFGAMPAIPDLSDEQIESIIAFIRDVQEREGFEPYPPE